jgi:hypothetical protein
LFYANFNAPAAGGLFQVLKDPRVLTALPLAPIYFYVYWRVHSGAAGSGAAPKTMAKAGSA